MTLMIPRVSLKPDAFLFACHTADSARLRRDGTFNSHLRFDPFLMNTYSRPASPDPRTLKKEIQTILKHHFDASPQFRKDLDVDLDTISYFTLAIATLFADLGSLFRAYTGLELPRIPSHDTEYSDSFPQLRRVIELYSASLKDEPNDEDAERETFDPFSVDEHTSLADIQVQQAEFAAEIWDIISDGIFTIFPEHAPAIMSFASWKYKTEERGEEIDWRIRPPVGDLFAKAFRGRGGPRAGASYGGRPAGRDGGRDHGNRGRDTQNRGPRPERSESRGEQLRGEPRSEMQADPRVDTRGSERPERGPRPERTDRPERGPRGPRPERSDSRGGRAESGAHLRNDPFIQSDDDLQPWLDEARLAVEQLRANPSLSEIGLRPSNSFIRRQQHSLLTEMGATTESRGEGRDRCIFVKLPG
ncbi:MAG: hypothetical protein IOD12_02730 [Silvanigrellales bacterium]|nr:hypothetical protein [Silvanigrellales bacterium]